MNEATSASNLAALERELAELCVSALNLEQEPSSIDPTDLLYGDGLGLDSIDILELALEVSRQIHRDVDNAVAVHAREELGVDPDDLPSPMLAAVSSFLSFAVGAFVPVLPYLLGANSLLPGLGITLLALFVCGALVTQVTNRTWWYGGLRQMLLGGAAAGLTYGFGVLVGGANLG